MKILLTGRSGQVGFELERSLSPLGEVVALDRSQLDLSNLSQIRATVLEHKPDIIVNPAAYTAVDKAESEQALAFSANAYAVKILADVAKELDALLVHYSTDYVFSGEGSEPHKEDDPKAPANVYGQSKLAGEEAIVASGAKHLIFRTSWVFGTFGNNFAKAMINLGKQRDRLTIVADQWGAPTSAALIADVSALVIYRYQLTTYKSSFNYGIYHLVASGETNWCEYARYVLQHAKNAGTELTIELDQILPIPTADYPTPAKRPLNSRLDTNKLSNTFDIQLPSWQQGVDKVLSQIL